jgi:hypothetical protein
MGTFFRKKTPEDTALEEKLASEKPKSNAEIKAERLKELDKELGIKRATGGAARIPRKKGQPVGSKKHSDLYTDENPKGTIQGLKFATPTDARKSVAKIKNSGRKQAHKIQAAVAMEQRAGVMGKADVVNVYRNYIDSIKKSKKEGGFISIKGKDYIRDLL